MKQTAIKAAKEAGKVIMKHYGKIGQVSFKKNKKDLLTAFDLKSEKTIIKIIKNKFPTHNIISEESGTENKNSEYTWIIDPIDGTTNYAQQIPYFCVSIALAKNNKIILGVVYNPLNKELYFAEKGKGAFLNNKKIKVSDKKKLDEAVVVFALTSKKNIAIKSLQKAESIFPYVRAIRNPGTVELILCDIACGRMDIFVTESILPWDAAAGYLIVKEAGGKITGLNNTEWNIDKTNILASNKKLHNTFLRLYNKK